MHRNAANGLSLGGITLGGEVDLALLVLVEVEDVSAEGGGGDGEDPGEGLGGLSGVVAVAEDGGEGAVNTGEDILHVGAGLVVGAPVVGGRLVEALLALGGLPVELLAELVDVHVLFQPS